MRDDTKFNGGIRDKNICRERDLRISTGGMRDSSKIDGGMRDQNIKSQVTDITRRTTAITRRGSPFRQGWDSGIEQKRSAMHHPKSSVRASHICSIIFKGEILSNNKTPHK